MVKQLLSKKLTFIVAVCAISPQLFAQSSWQIAAVDISIGRPTTYHEHHIYAEYLSKITASPKTLEKVYFDTREKNNYNVTLGKVDRNGGVCAGATLVFKKQTKNKFISASEIQAGISYFSLPTAIKYTSTNITPNQTRSLYATYNLKFTDIRFNVGYYFYTPILHDRLDLYAGGNIYYAFSVGSEIKATPTYIDEVNRDDNGNVTTAFYKQKMFDATTNFIKPWSNYGVQIPVGFLVSVADRSKIFANYYIDFNFRAYNQGNVSNDVYHGFNIGYRYMF